MSHSDHETVVRFTDYDSKFQTKKNCGDAEHAKKKLKTMYEKLVDKSMFSFPKTLILGYLVHIFK